MSATPPDGPRRANGLAGETSPYLLQHRYNPVDWQPWGPAALARARDEDKPIFLSIGYAACHWCHVMERESFEDPRVAALLNRHFVPIKVDREERPDLDEIYMSAVQLMTGQGGWPLSVFLTPRLEPFFGGTYFPPDARYGRIGFGALLERLQESWASSRSAIDRSAAAMTASLARLAAPPAATRGQRVGRNEATRAVAEIVGRFDPVWGGLGGAPKFPPDGALALLLLEHAETREAVPLAVAERTLDGMARGGIYDHVGGGFARYSVDERWLVPHFEKMLYNQALLVPSYVDAWLLTKKPLYRRVVEQTLDFVARELLDPAGGFWSSLDADSEGEEGKYYVWTPEEVDALLGRDLGAAWRAIYDVTPEGNFEEHSIPNLLGASLAEVALERQETEEALARHLAPLTSRLAAARAKRVRPATDDKVLTSWNGLMISACCRAYQALGRPADLALAEGAAEFLWSTMAVDGRLLASWRAGRARLNAYLDDHAFLGRALLELYESGFERVWLERAASLAEAVLARFEDREGGFFFTSHDHEALLTRTRSLTDGALPSGAGVATELLLRLATHLDRDDFRQAAERALAAHAQLVRRAPAGSCSLLVAADRLDRPRPEIALTGRAGDPELAALLAVVRGRPRGSPVLQLAAEPGEGPSELPLLRGKHAADGRATAWVCRDYACKAPTSDPATLARQLGDS